MRPGAEDRQPGYAMPSATHLHSRAIPITPILPGENAAIVVLARIEKDYENQYSWKTGYFCEEKISILGIVRGEEAQYREGSRGQYVVRSIKSGLLFDKANALRPLDILLERE